MKVTGLFRHPELAPFARELDASPTAQSWLARIDRLPINVRIREVPAESAPQREKFKYALDRTAASYRPATNTMDVPRTSIMRGSVSVGGFKLEGVGDTAARVLLHEGVHRVQRGSLVGWLARLAFVEPVQAAASGVRSLAKGDRSKSAPARFLEGVDRVALRDEVEAFAIDGRVARELGQANGKLKSSEEIFQEIRGGYGHIATRQRVAYLAVPPLTLGTGAAIGAAAVTVARQPASN